MLNLYKIQYNITSSLAVSYYKLHFIHQTSGGGCGIIKVFDVHSVSRNLILN